MNVHSPDLRAAARALGGEVVKGRIVCPGPGHSDKDRSLSAWFDRTAPDGFVVHSLAGDDWRSCKDHVRAKLGFPEWRPGDTEEGIAARMGERARRDPLDFKGAAPQRDQGSAKPRIVAEYVYNDEFGAPYAKALRYDPKDFKQQHWTGSAWAWGKPKGPKMPYRLPELLAASDKPVFVVEGEKDANKLASLGFIATSASEGAGKWTPELGQWFKAKTVYILADNDGPGRAHARQVAENLHGVAAEVRIVELPGLPEKGDVSDWLEAGNDPGGLEALCLEAPVYAPGAASEESRDEPEGPAEEPLPLFPQLPPAEPYPIEALGPVLSRAASAIASKVQVPEAIAAQSVLAAAALAAQAHADVALPYGQPRPLSLYLVTVAASGDRKSTADHEALWPVRKREKVLRELRDAAIEEWKIDHAVWSTEKKRIEGDKKMDRHARKDALRALGPEPEPPLHAFLTAPDPTVEGLAKAWTNAPAALGLFTAEGGMFSGGAGMSDEHRLKTAAALSELWDGKPLKRIRAGDGVTILPGRRLALHVMVQPDAASDLLADPLLRDQGLLSRILVAAPDSIAGSRRYRDPDPRNEAGIQAYGARVLSLLEASLPLAEGKRSELEPRALHLSADAEKHWREFFDHVEDQCGPAGDLRAIGDFAAKAAEHAARIAGVLTIVEDADATEVGAEAMVGAITLSDWYVAEALRLQQGARTDPKLKIAQKLLTWLQERGEEEINFRDVLKFGPGALRTKDAADGALAVLIKHGWVAETSSRPRRLRVVRP